MKTMRYLLLLLLAMAMAVPAVAQVIEDGEAFYIYRNDGNFDGFFYDEVKEIRYSKLDLNNEEHEDYVVQEVVLEDSIHRIPLAAIDSVGFVQPEIKFNPALKNMDELGITPYVTAVAGQTLTILKTLPASLRPKKNDVLVGFTGVFEEKGFGGKVIRLVDNGDSWRVQTERLTDLKDLFEQFICIEQVKADEQGNARRRMSGLNGPRKASGGGSINIVNLSGTVTGEVDFIGDNSSASANMDVGVQFSIGVAYNITWRTLFTKFSTDLGVRATPSFTVKAGKDFEKALTGIPKFIRSIKFPATCPIFQTTPLPDFFFRGSGEMSVKATLPTMMLNLNQSFIIDSSRDFPLSYSLSTTPTTPPLIGNDFFDVTSTDFEVSLNGFLQTGVKFNFDIATNDWASDIFESSIGAYVYVGPKLEGSLKLSAAGLATGGAYGMLNGSMFKFTAVSADLEAKGKIKILWDDPEEKTFFSSNLSFGEWEWYLLPKMKHPFYFYDQSCGELVCATDFDKERNILFPLKIGYTLYDETNTNKIDEWYDTETYSVLQAPEKIEHRFENLPMGKYYLRNSFKLFGVPIDSPAQSCYVSAYLNLPKKRFDIGYDQESFKIEIPYKTNAELIGIPGATDYIKAGDKLILDVRPQIELVGGLQKYSPEVVVKKDAESSPYLLYEPNQTISLDTKLYFKQEPVPISYFKKATLNLRVEDFDMPPVLLDNITNPFTMNLNQADSVFTLSGKNTYSTNYQRTYLDGRTWLITDTYSYSANLRFDMSRVNIFYEFFESDAKGSTISMTHHHKEEVVDDQGRKNHTGDAECTNDDYDNCPMQYDTGKYKEEIKSASGTLRNVHYSPISYNADRTYFHTPRFHKCWVNATYTKTKKDTLTGEETSQSKDYPDGVNDWKAVVLNVGLQR